MAQYTPNLNLYMPDSTDDFGEFREEHNDNMVKIDNAIGGGGGSGGHTIIDENGQSMTQRTGLQFTGNVQVTDDSGNGRTVVDILGGGGNVYGAFLDPSRVIYSAFTFDSSAHTWTATEDVILTDNLYPVDGSTASYILIDGKGVFASYTFGDPFVYVKKGQVVTYRGKSGSNMKAYGILQGTNGIFAPVIYSDNERVIGIWRDNKPLYAKTWDLGSDLLINSNAWTNTTILVSNFNIENIIQASGLNSGGSFFGFLGANRDQTYVQILQTRNAQITLRYVILLYTKTTDFAGSGNWNTDGVPTVHYSTSEQVIGTYLGKPLYQRTWDNLAVSLTAYAWSNTGLSATDIDTIVDGTMQDDNKQKISGTIGFMSSHTYIGVYPQIGNRNLTTLTVQYTKITD